MSARTSPRCDCITRGDSTMVLDVADLPGGCLNEAGVARSLLNTRGWFVAAIVCLVGLLPPGYAAPPAGEAGFRAIFNGKDLAGWIGDSAHWTVEDGAITGSNSSDKPLKHNSFLIWEGGKPSDFELRFTYRIVGGNSGVQYRSK